MTDATVVCILGMQRSGTSLVTRMLNLCGMYLGPTEHLMPANAANPRGYWEHRPLQQINEEIFARLGESEAELRHMESGWELSSSLNDLRRSARSIVDQDFGEAELWGWKDPRTSWTLPFWQTIIPRMRYVICIRHPLDAARSIARRDELPIEEGVYLWLTYTKAALVHTATEERIFVCYENIMHDPLAALQQLAGFVGRPQAADDSAVRHSVQAFVDSSLWHHRSSASRLHGHQMSDNWKEIMRSAVDAYSGLRDGGIAAHQEALQTVTTALDTATPLIRELRHTLWMQRVRAVLDKMNAVIPLQDLVIFVDGDEWPYTWDTKGPVPYRRAVSFVRRDEGSWDEPADDRAAICRLEQLRQAGATFIVFPWLSQWWLDVYPEFRWHLSSKYRCTLANEHIVAYDLRPAVGGAKSLS